MTDRKKTKKSKDSPVDKPHDRLVRVLLSNVSNARDIIEAYLPQNIQTFFDLGFLEQQKDTFIDSQHRMHAVDVLFKTRCKNTKEEAYIWVLIEQQRKPDVWMPLRIFCYIAVIWDNLRKQSKSSSTSVKIPFIYPLVISNASKPYNHSLSLRDLIEPEEARVLFDEMFKKPLQLVDLATIPDDAMREQLQNHVRAQAFLLSLKHVFDDNLQSLINTVLLHPFRALDAMGAGDDVANLLYYLYNEGNLTDPDNFFAFLHQHFSRDVEEKIMTLGQQAEFKAMQKGIEEGARKQAKKSALCLLEKNLSIDLIAEATSLSTQEIMRLANKAKKGH